jgi:hypothetical protein
VRPDQTQILLQSILNELRALHKAYRILARQTHQNTLSVAVLQSQRDAMKWIFDKGMGILSFVAFLGRLLVEVIWKHFR